jgi:4-carboxymuconolactone decarboxylase
MDQKRYEIGLKMRKQVLGDAYVERALANVDDFNRDFQRLLTEYCWGETWGDDTLKPRERSILNLGMIGALGKMEEFATHVRGALNNGLTPNEIRAALTQITIYCGAPKGVDCFRVAKPVIAEYEKNKKSPRCSTSPRQDAQPRSRADHRSIFRSISSGSKPLVCWCASIGR